MVVMGLHHQLQVRLYLGQVVVEAVEQMQQLLEMQGAEELVVVVMAGMQLLEQMEPLTRAGEVEAVVLLAPTQGLLEEPEAPVL
jgi:hypothetical protein